MRLKRCDMGRTVYYQWGNTTLGRTLFMAYEGRPGEEAYRKHKYIGYSLREAFRRFKDLLGIKRARLEKVDWLFMSF